jgi:hypothetical protein
LENWVEASQASFGRGKMTSRGIPVGTIEEDEREDMDADNNDDSGDEQDDGPDEADDGETGDESNQPDNSEIEKFTRASATETGKPADVQAGEGKKRERSNAKAVECLDLEGNVIEVFRSGMAASMKLNIPQGDISLCCRGMKPSVMGFKFRFSGETEERQAQRLKKGFVLDYGGFDQGKVELTRTTRASRGEYGQGNRHADIGSRSILDPPELKVRLSDIPRMIYPY